MCAFLCVCLYSDIDNSGYVSDFELQELFREASFSLPGYRVREIIEIFVAGDTNKDEKISFGEFVSVSSGADCEQILYITHSSNHAWSNTACPRSDLPRAEEQGVQRDV